jgi:hypothetical protein
MGNCPIIPPKCRMEGENTEVGQELMPTKWLKYIEKRVKGDGGQNEIYFKSP